MRKFKVLSLILLSLTVLGCAQLKAVSEANTGSDILSNAEKLKRIESELRAMPQFQGKSLMVFQQINFFNIGMITVQIEDPDKPGNIDQYTYQGGVWLEPSPVQISGDGEMKDNLTPLDDVKFETVAIIHKNWKEKAKTVEGAADKEPEMIYFSLSVQDQQRSWGATDVPGDRETHSISFNLDGSVKETKKK